MPVINIVAENDAQMLEYLLRDPTSNGFAIEDIRDMPRDGEFYSTKDPLNNQITGYLLNHYEGNELFVTLKSQLEQDAAQLLTRVPTDNSLTIYLHTDPNYEQTVSNYFLANNREFEKADDFLMVVEKNTAKLVHPNLAKIITRKYKRDVAMLISHSTKDELTELASQVLDQGKIWGMIVDGHVVSLAAIASSQPEIGVIVDVNTHPSYRRKGYGTLVTSAATERALRDSKVVSLFVNASNVEAIRLYEKLGYKFNAKSIRFKANSK
jgi:ribosomal protein S18 acetylase RimI-like enzyme